MRTRIVRIGNSQGVRIPKLLLEEVGLDGDVELRVEEGRLVIENVREPRAGWEKAAAEVARAEEGALEPGVATDFDQEEWVWE